MKQLFSILQILTITGWGYCCFGQGNIAANNVIKSKLLILKTKSDSINEIRSPEKLYLQFDKPYYAIGDTIWFKAYLLNSYLKPSDSSEIIHIDIANDSNKVIKQYRLPVQVGLTWGNIILNDKEFAPGSYTLRAYTKWMLNFGDDYFYYKSFYISSAGENSLLVNTRFNTSVVTGNNTLTAKLMFSDMNKTPFAVKPLLVQVFNGNKRLYKQNTQTGVDGVLDVNFAIPQKSSGLAIVAESEQKDKKVVIPVVLNRPDKADVQFLPEGGSLVAGLNAHVGFKAIGEDGKGLNVSGSITDHAGKEVMTFKSLHNGMGSFDLAVPDAEGYTAKVTLPGGIVKDYPLPTVKATGTVLQVKNTMEGDSLQVIIEASNDIAQSGESYFLIGKARSIVCYAAVVNFHEGNYVKRKIAKTLFPTGITHFTLMTTKYQPLNERLAFIDHQNNLNIKLNTDKPFYSKRDSVALKLKVTDKEGNRVIGNFSLAVTDDAQVKIDTLNSENLLIRLLLTSDLKGYIEEPGYYLSSKTSEARQVLDNLLLTQGWVGYDWKQVLNPAAIAYQTQQELEVKGRVINAFNKPVKGTNVLLFSKSPAILMDTVTDDKGEFVFNRFPRVDTPIFVLKAVNKNGKSFNVGINVDEVKPPDFIRPVSPLTMPWYVNSDSTLLKYAKNKALIKQQESFPTGGHVLKEVKIIAKKVVQGSQNLNGPGNADVVLDEKDLEAAGKKTWLQLLQENLPKFTDSYFAQGASLKARKDLYLSLFVTDEKPIEKQESPPQEWYFVDGKPLMLIVDGISVNEIIKVASFRDMTDYLTSHSAEDIKGFEIVHSTKYAAAYYIRYQPHSPIDLVISASSNFPPVLIGPSDFAFLEITTRSGHGPDIGSTPGMYLYKPLPFSWPKQFYKPKYIINDTTRHLPDLRSTIDWEPNIITDTNGEATVSFYTADKPSTYTIIMEGTDMNGSLGYKTGKIIIDKAKGKN